jgi:hypothetical protein
MYPNPRPKETLFVTYRAKPTVAETMTFES